MLLPGANKKMKLMRDAPVSPREKEERILELDARRGIYETVKKYAGSHFREIERKSGLSTGSVRYHLDYLTKRGLIKEERDGNTLRYFPKEFKSENTRLLGLLRQESIRRIILFLLTHRGCSHEEIVEAVGVSPSTISWHLKKLEEYNIVGSTRQGRVKNYQILINEEEIINLLITYKESFLDALVDRVIDMWA
jgi:predicted transcriptional regulator